MTTQITDIDRALATDLRERMKAAAEPIALILQEAQQNDFQINFQIGIRPDGSPDVRVDVLKFFKV